MTQQNALDLIVKNNPQFEKVYDAYQDVFNALKEKTQEKSTGTKKLHSISEVKFSRSSTPFDKDPICN